MKPHSTRLVLVYTSNKKYVIATEKDVLENAIENGAYLFEGYSKYQKKNLSTALEKCRNITLIKGVKNPFKNFIPLGFHI